jgi:hypothetical protein
MAAPAWIIEGDSDDRRRALSGGSEVAPPPRRQRRGEAEEGDTNMDEGEGSTAAKGGGRGRGNGKSKGGRKKGMTADDEFVVDLAKLTLAIQLNQREMMAAVINTVIVDEDTPMIRAMQSAGKNYHELCVGKAPNEHNKGPPCIHVAFAMLSCLKTHEKVPDDVKQAIVRLQTSTWAQTVDEVSSAIRCCKLAKCWKKDLVKIQFAFRGETADTTVLKALKAMGGDIKYGKAPAGGLETKVQKHLNNA